jgi:hypothetical protein
MPDYTLGFNRYAYAMNNPLIYIDPDGELAWFVPVIAGAVIGFEAGGWISSGTPAFWKWEGEDWAAAGVGAMVGAVAGGLTAAAIGPAGGITGMTTQVNGTLVATKGWGITSTALQSASLNIGMSAIQGQGLEGMWKAGITGLASGAWAATGGLGLVKEGFLGKLAYQNVGLAGRSIGRNWAAGVDLFSKVSVGLGPVNLTLGEDQSLLQWQNNIGNIAFNTIGLANLATGGKMNFDWKNLTPVYSGGALDKISQGAMGAYGIMGDQMSVRRFHSHELHHVWQSRSLGDMFLPLYAMQGLSAFIMGQSPIGKANYFETQAYGYYWWR